MFAEPILSRGFLELLATACYEVVGSSEIKILNQNIKVARFIKTNETLKQSAELRGTSE